MRAADVKKLRRNIKMFKKVLSLVLALVMISALAVSFTSCGGDKDDGVFRLGVICLHDEASTNQK